MMHIRFHLKKPQKLKKKNAIVLAVDSLDGGINGASEGTPEDSSKVPLSNLYKNVQEHFMSHLRLHFKEHQKLHNKYKEI